jgi:hypothetical protein
MSPFAEVGAAANYRFAASRGQIYVRYLAGDAEPPATECGGFDAIGVEGTFAVVLDSAPKVFAVNDAGLYFSSDEQVHFMAR